MVVFGLNYDKSSQDPMVKETYLFLRNQVINEFTSICKKENHKGTSAGYSTVSQNDLKKNFFEIQYSRIEDVEKALSLQNKVYKQFVNNDVNEEVNFAIGVQTKEERSARVMIEMKKESAKSQNRKINSKHDRIFYEYNKFFEDVSDNEQESIEFENEELYN